MSNYAKETDTYLTAIKHGDLTQFKPLYDLVANHLRVVVMCYLNDKSYWEDVLSEVFEKVLRYIDSYTEGSDGYNWLCKIAENTAYNYNAKAGPEVALSDVERKLYVSSSEIVSEDLLDLLRAIDNLSQPFKDTVYKYFFFGETMEEIGREFNICKAAVKKRLNKAIEKLKKFIENGKL